MVVWLKSLRLEHYFVYYMIWKFQTCELAKIFDILLYQVPKEYFGKQWLCIRLFCHA